MVPAEGSPRTAMTYAPAAPSVGIAAIPEMHQSMRSHEGFPLSNSLLYEWEELATDSRAAPYLYPGWVHTWWHAFGTGDLDVHTLRRGGRLVGVLPMVRNRHTLESAANYHTPEFGILTQDSETTWALAQGLFADRPAHVSLTSLDPAAETIDACQHAADEAGYKVVIRTYQRSLYIDLDGTWDGYESGLGRNLLRNLRRARKRLEQEGRLGVEIAYGHEQFDESLREAYAVEASGWKGAGRTAIESHPQTLDFYTDIARWGAAHDMLRLYFLRLEGRPLAMYFALVHEGTCHLLKGGYDPVYWRYSPGNLLMHTVIRDCFGAGLTRIEFNGDAEPYKFNWAAAVHERKRFEAFAPNAAGRLAWTRFTYMRPLARRLRSAFGFHPD